MNSWLIYYGLAQVTVDELTHYLIVKIYSLEEGDEYLPNNFKLKPISGHNQLLILRF